MFIDCLVGAFNEFADAPNRSEQKKRNFQEFAKDLRQRLPDLAQTLRVDSSQFQSRLVGITELVATISENLLIIDGYEEHVRALVEWTNTPTYSPRNKQTLEEQKIRAICRAAKVIGRSIGRCVPACRNETTNVANEILEIIGGVVEPELAAKLRNSFLKGLGAGLSTIIHTSIRENKEEVIDGFYNLVHPFFKRYPQHAYLLNYPIIAFCLNRNSVGVRTLNTLRYLFKKDPDSFSKAYTIAVSRYNLGSGTEVDEAALEAHAIENSKSLIDALAQGMKDLRRKFSESLERVIIGIEPDTKEMRIALSLKEGLVSKN